MKKKIVDTLAIEANAKGITLVFMRFNHTEDSGELVTYLIENESEALDVMEGLVNNIHKLWPDSVIDRTLHQAYKEYNNGK